MTESMAKAISETERRRKIQQRYNKINNIVPKSSVKKSSNSILKDLNLSRKLKANDVSSASKSDSEVILLDETVSLEDLPSHINQLEESMKQHATNLEFEEASRLRDRIKKLRSKLLGRK